MPSQEHLADNIEVTVVTTLRPEILSRTLESFAAHVHTRRQLFLVANIDAAPADTPDSEKAELVSRTIDALFGVRTAAGKYLFNIDNISSVHVHTVPSFARAVRTLWQSTRARYVFHLEDDWDFVRDIDLDECIAVMDRGEADYIRFSKRGKPVDSEYVKPSLLPSLWRGDMVRALAKGMCDTQDPEKQLRRGQGNGLIDAALPLHILDWPGGVCVMDSGREWREQRGLVKWNKPMTSGEDLSFRGEVTWTRG